MIFGLGCDIVNVKRIAKSPEFLEHFKQKICGPDELKELDGSRLTYQELACSLAKLYAAKEAFSKAIGTGFRNGLSFKDIQVLHNGLGKPELKVSGSARLSLSKQTESAALFVSLSDDFPYAEAVVIIEKP